MTILIPYKHSDNNELRYALRSICEYYPESEVIVSGEASEWFVGQRVYRRQNGLTAQINVRDNIFAAFELLSDDFILWYDDLFALSGEAITPTHCGLLKDINLSNYGQWFAACLANTIKDYPDGYYYGNHHPMVINKHLFAEAMQLDWRKDYIIKSIYGNYASVGGEYAEDCKTKHGTDVREFIKGRRFFSSQPNPTKDVLQLLNELWPEKCKYER